MSDCRLCVAIQSVPESELVQAAVSKGELSVETLLTGMRDSVVLGWALRDMLSEDPASALCDVHSAQVRDFTSADESP